MSSGLSQAKRIASFKTPLGEDFFVITRFDATEGLSELFEYRIEALSKAENADLSSMLGEKCEIKYKLRGGKTRYFNGVLVEAQWLGHTGSYYAYRFVLKPWLWLLSQRSDCKIFQKKTAPEIIKEIFNKEGKKDFDDRLSEQYQRMEYCVQYRETDLSFVLRLMEQHGIYYYFKHSADAHKLVLSDSKSSHDLQQSPLEPPIGSGRPPPADGSYPFLPRGSQDRRFVEHMMEWFSERRLRTGKVELNDYDFKQSTASLRRMKEDGIAAAKKYELYDYPGKYTDRNDGQRFAEIRVQAQQALDERRYATGEAFSLYPGALFRLSGHYASSENTEHLVVRATHRFEAEAYRSGGEGGDLYEGSYEFLKSERRFRAPVVTPKPLIHGPQTAKVVAKNRQQGEEIDVDEYGRIFVQFHWDRDDDTTSRPVRVAQVWAGKGWGGQVIPRIGQEVVVEFLEGDPDEPIVVGTVYNDQHKLPYELPANKTQSGIKSNSSKGGGGYNELKFEDKKGEEVVTFHAEKDLNSVVLNAETREIGEKFSSGASRKTTLKNGDDVLDVDSGSLLVEAKVSIVLKVGNSTVKIEPNSVTIDSPTVTVKSMETSVKGDVKVAVTGGMITLN
jgi:type VI secretion system secreted protein VgrG